MPNVEALRQLRRVVEDAPDELLHMNAMVSEAPCGTARCASGWCLVDPWFQENTRLGDYADETGRHFPFGLTSTLQETFGLDYDSYNALFGGTVSVASDPHAIPKAAVLANVDALIAGRKPTPYMVRG